MLHVRCIDIRGSGRQVLQAQGHPAGGYTNAFLLYFLSGWVCSPDFGLQGEPEVCEGCGGAGGVRCFACDGTGAMASTDDEANLSPAQQRKVGTSETAGHRSVHRGGHIISTQ